MPPELISAPIHTPIPHGSIRFPPSFRPGRMMAATPNWSNASKIPRSARRIRKEMETPSTEWDNEWQEIAGPEAILVSVVQNPQLLPLQGKTIAESPSCGTKTRLTPFSIFWSRTTLSLRLQCSGCPSLTYRWRSSSRGFQWIMIRKAPRPDGLLGQEHPHPRAYGTFPRILRKYVREEKKLRLEDAIRKFSALPAQRMRLSDRGV